MWMQPKLISNTISEMSFASCNFLPSSILLLITSQWKPNFGSFFLFSFFLGWGGGEGGGGLGLWGCHLVHWTSSWTLNCIQTEKQIHYKINSGPEGWRKFRHIIMSCLLVCLLQLQIATQYQHTLFTKWNNKFLLVFFTSLRLWFK